MTNLLTISIVTITFNTDLELFKETLTSIKKQKYNKKLIEHIVVDGGSTNGTVELAKEYGCIVIIQKQFNKQELVRQSIGIKKSKGDIVLILESDNILPSEKWLEEMVLPFMSNKNVICTFSAHNTYRKSMSLTTRYCALFGSTDPLLYYLGKSEKIPMIQKHYDKGLILAEDKNYYIIQFNKFDLPTIGDNGQMILRSAIAKVNKNHELYLHTDAIAQLTEMEHNTFGVVKNSIIHIANPSILGLIRRRIEVKSKYYDGMRGKRRYLVFNWRSLSDLVKLLKFIVASLTIIYPLYESIKGYTKIKDKAWFLHPLLCFITLVGYGYSEIIWIIKKTLRYI